MEREGTWVKRTAVSPLIDHLEKQLVRLCFPIFIPFSFPSLSPLSLASPNYLTSHLCLITAESATVTQSHIIIHSVHLLCRTVLLYTQTEHGHTEMLICVQTVNWQLILMKLIKCKVFLHQMIKIPTSHMYISEICYRFNLSTFQLNVLYVAQRPIFAIHAFLTSLT